MSNDMLGPLMRALVGVPVKMLGLVLDIVNRLGSADAEAFYTDLAKFVRGWKKIAVVVVKRTVNLLHLPPITSDGRNGHQFIEVMEANGYNLGDWAKNVMTVGKNANGNLILTSTSGVTYKPVVIKGDEFTDVERNTANIRKVAVGLKLVTPPWWLAPLLREAMSDEEIEKLGLDWLIVMHDAITDSDGGLSLLGLSRYGSRRLDAFSGDPSDTWNRQYGFVFLAPQE